jgi:hypothetical protein
VVIRSQRHAIADHGGIGVERINPRLFETNPRRVGVQFLGNEHRQRGGDALTHFLARHLHGHQAVGAYPDPAGEHRVVGAGLQPGRGREFVALAVEAPCADGQRAACDGCSDEETAAPLVARPGGVSGKGVHD